MSHKCEECVHYAVCKHTGAMETFKSLYENISEGEGAFELFKSHVFCRYYMEDVNEVEENRYLEHLVAQYESQQIERDDW